MNSQTAFSQLQSFLKEMFQFDDHDLDFGIYRIIRLKKNFIQNFIDGHDSNSLQEVVRDALSQIQSSAGESARNWLCAFVAQFGDRGRDLWQPIEDNPLDKNARQGFEKLLVLASEKDRNQARKHLDVMVESGSLSLSDLESRVYNHLLNFFELYYNNGDFGYNSRASQAFKVPYEADYDGSDTMFHWKHKNSYYIKTGNGFRSVRCMVNESWLEFRMSRSGQERITTDRNNVKESDSKHYQLEKIQPVSDKDSQGKPVTVWQVLFRLASSSTPKAELYQKIWIKIFDPEADLAAYLHKKPDKDNKYPGKSVFNDLAESHNQVQGGQIKGVAQLRLKEDTYFNELAKRDEFKELGSNIQARADALGRDPIARNLYEMDRRLNTFFAGNDADFFIHKDLQGFLSTEKDRYIKNVIFSDVKGLLLAGEDNTTLLVARAFNQVADRIIAFLDAIETFQKNLFELKKKVVDTHYLISAGRIPDEFYPRLLAGEEQLVEWKDVFLVDVQNPDDLAKHPTLVVDTSLYNDSDPELQDDILSHPAFDNLDEQTDGLLINSENWQALNLLQEKFRQKIQCIHIDPPYNTSSSGFLYKNNYRHSSWLSMMDNRIEASLPLLSEQASFMCHIDENEYENLFNLFSAFELPNAGTVVWDKRNPMNAGRGVATQHEYIVWMSKDNSPIYQRSDHASKMLSKVRGLIKHEGGKVTDKVRKEYSAWVNANKDLSGGEKAYRYIDKEGKIYQSVSLRAPEPRTDKKFHQPLFHPETKKPCPVPPNGFSRTPETLKLMLKNGEILFGADESTQPRQKVLLTKKSKRQITSIIQDAKKGKAFTSPLGFEFPYCHPVSLYELLIGSVTHDNEPFVLDIFAGSGTTGHAVINLNQDNVRRRFILVEMGDYFDRITKPRISRVMFSSKWKNGKPENQDGYQGLVKIQTLEQYEDLLDNLVPVWDGAALPEQVPVRYLYMPESNALSASLDISRPFSQTMRVGKNQEVKGIDLLETWCYLQGYWIRSKRVFRGFDRVYRAALTTRNVLVLFRDIKTGEDDAENIRAVCKSFADTTKDFPISRLEVNHYIDLRQVDLPVQIITADDFLRGVRWS